MSVITDAVHDLHAGLAYKLFLWAIWLHPPLVGELFSGAVRSDEWALLPGEEIIPSSIMTKADFEKGERP